MKVIFEYSDDEFIRQMIFSGFKEFLEVHVCCYEDYKNYKVHFIGSVAFLFKEQLSEACDFYQIQIGQVIRKPIDGLISYHLARLSV